MYLGDLRCGRILEGGLGARFSLEESKKVLAVNQVTVFTIHTL